MIKFLVHSEIDKKRWDQCIDQSPGAIIYAYSWYLDIVSPGWNALVGDEYAAVFPLTWRKKWGIAYLYQPVYTQQLGLFISKESKEYTVMNFLNAIPLSYRLIEIQLNQSNSGFPVHHPFKSGQRITHILDLSPDANTLEKKISENTKRNMRRFEKSSMSIISDANPEGLVKLFRKNRGKDILQLSNQDYENFLSLCEEALRRKLMTYLGAIDSKGILQAGVIFLQTNTGFILLFSALSEEGKSSGAMSALIAAFIREHAGKNRILDFEGSMDPGIARFYKSFGSHEIVYLQIRNNRLPVPFRWLKN